MTMLTFRYKAADARGVRQRGEVQAATVHEAYRKIAAQGLTPIEIGAGHSKHPAHGRRIRAQDLSDFTHQLSVLMSAKVSVSDGLMCIAEQEKNPQLRCVISDIATRIQAGASVAAALEAHRHQFGEVYIQTIRAAETSGTLTAALEHLSEMLERTAEMTRQVRSAFMYPACVCGVLAAGMAFLLVYVVPKFAAMFASRGVDLPLMTELLMGFGDAVRSGWWVIAGTALAAVVAFRRIHQTEAGQLALDRLLHRTPVIGRVLQGLAIARFARVLGLTIGSGLPLIECLHLAGGAGARPMLRADAARLVDQVRAGGRLASVLPNCRYLTLFARRMLSAGEESAELPRMCSVVARHYDHETAHLAKNSATLIEPLLIVGIAAVVLIVALAIFVPMWDMVKVMS